MSRASTLLRSSLFLAHIEDTMQFRFWCLGFGDHVDACCLFPWFVDWTDVGGYRLIYCILLPPLSYMSAHLFH